jgi:hypothetical protein
MNPEVHTTPSGKEIAVPVPGKENRGADKKVNPRTCSPVWIVIFLIVVTLPAACLPHKKMTVWSAAALLEDIAAASYKQSDLRVIREGMPAYLLLMDGMVEAWPKNDRLLLGAAQGYASYASAFVEDRDNKYASVLYAKARDYALKSLVERGFKKPREKLFDEFAEDLNDLGQNDVPYLFWSAASWGSWIGLNLNSMEAIAELPRVELMMKKVLELDEGFYYGGPHLFMGIWFASRPKIAGGNLDLARDHFRKAAALGQGKFLMTEVYYAQYYARRKFDEDLFKSILQKVLDTPADIVPELTLLNTVAHQKAKKMLDNLDEYF